MDDDALTLEILLHREQKCIAIRGRLNAAAERAVRKFPGRLFSKTHACWYVVYSEVVHGALRNALAEFQGVIDRVVHQYSNPTNSVDLNEIVLPEGYHEQLIRVRYSHATINTYESQMRKFLIYIKPRSIDEISHAEILKYLEHLVSVRKVSVSTQNTAINAIKFYLEHVQRGERRTYFIDRPIKEHRLPRVLSEPEVKAMIQATVNTKHQCMLLLLYSAGLRMSELLNLKWVHFDIERKQLFVDGGKGKKDRMTLLSDHVASLVKQYLSSYHPVHYLFEGPGGGKYSARSVNKIVSKAAAKAGIQKRVSAHTLRHSFATHLLEHGTDIRYIQALMGHESGRTTERYTHVTTKGFSKIVSPVERLGLFGSDETASMPG